MAAFGEGYRHHVTGLVHDERGFPTQQPKEVDQFMNRLHDKITKGFPEIMISQSFDMDDAEVVVIAYGCVSRSAMMAIKKARAQGIKAGLVQMITLFPFPRKIIDAALRQCKAAIVPELNMGQMSREINRVNQTGTQIVKLNRIDGHLITPDEILKKVLSVA